MNRYLVDEKRYAAVARQMAAEGAVLLENEGGTLPLLRGDRVAVFGRSQLHYYKSGTGSGGMVNAKYVVGILDALKAEEGIAVDGELERVYREWDAAHPLDRGGGWAREPWSYPEMPLSREVARAAAERNDAAVVIIGRTAGEDQDASAEKGSYLLSDAEEEMLKAVCGEFEAAGRRVAVVLNVGNIIDMGWLSRVRPGAVLYAWQGGMEGGNAVADVLTGRVCPCGKLSDTIAASIGDYPSTPYFGGENGDRYAEDIYVGYRYFETFARDRVLYPFGYGLSYTTFEVSCGGITRVAETPGENEQGGNPQGGNEQGGNPQGEDSPGANGADGNSQPGVRILARVKNTGSRAGKEVVCCYASAPQGALGKPERVLIAFAKTKELLPGEEQEMELFASDREMASYDEATSRFVMEAGEYKIYVGTDARSARLSGTFTEDVEREVLMCTNALAPEEPYKRMRPVGSGTGDGVAGGDGSGTGDYAVGWEDVPLRRDSMAEREAEGLMAVGEIPYAGDLGITLGDVYDGRADLESFASQLSDEDLCCLVRGEGMCSPKVTPGCAAAFGGVTERLSSMGVPAACCADGPSGIRMDCGYYAFSLPIGTCIACSFNEDLARELYSMVGAELRKNKVDILLGPGINIHRNPLNGRNFEYFSEDPLLTGRMASAIIRGMGEYGVTGAVKHFAANNQEHNRYGCNAVVSERALREIYLRGFEIAVKEGGATAIMTTYGALNGRWTASHYDLLTTVLRREWHFGGFVMTDWWASMNDEGGEPSLTNAAAMIRAQNDIYMVTADAAGNANGDNLMEALSAGRLGRGPLQRSAMAVLRAVMRSPAMERSLGRTSAEELEADRIMLEAGRADLASGYEGDYPLLEGELAFPTEGRDTSRGKSVYYGFRTESGGSARLSMKIRVDALGMGQVPFSVFINGELAGAYTKRSTSGAWEDFSQPLGSVPAGDNVIRLFFAEGGASIDALAVRID